MDLPNGGGVVDVDKGRRGKKVAQEAGRKGGEEEARFISSLLTESEALEKGASPRGSDGAAEGKEALVPGSSKAQNKEVELSDIAKDLRKIKVQNTVTHVLLGTVILMTAAWQVNEVSFLLWVQRKLSNPFKSLGDLIKASLKLKGRGRPVIESSPLPPVGVPDVTRADLPTLVISGDHR